MIRQVSVKCINCDTELNVNFYDVLTLDKKVKKQIEEDKLFKIVCHKCHKEMRFNYDCLFVDQNNHYALSLIQTNDIKLEKNFISSFNYLGDDLIKRIVHNRFELLEKIYLYDDHLNDYVVEVMKALISLSLVKEYGSEKKITIYYHHDQKPSFVVYLDKESYGFDFEQDLYNQLLLDLSNEDDDCFKTVDYKWALEYLSKIYQ